MRFRLTCTPRSHAPPRCSSSRPPRSWAGAQTAASAPVDGDSAHVAEFAGEWVGGYTCDETGRHGTVVFRLAAGVDSVRAVVLMIPRATDGDLFPTAVPLAVHRVEVTGGTLRGVLARYEDPEWRLPLETTFSGTLDGAGRIEGVFRADGTQIDTIPQRGRWWAVRAADRPLARR